MSMAWGGKSRVMESVPNLGRCSVSYEEVMRSLLEECKSLNRWHNSL